MSMIVCVTVVHKKVCYDCGELSSRNCAILAFINFSIILKVSGPQNKVNLIKGHNLSMCLGCALSNAWIGL